LRVQLKEGGILHLRLNKYKRPIVNKYLKGKMKRTLKREFKEREIAERETLGTIVVL